MEKEILDSVISGFISEMVDQTSSLFDGAGKELKQFFNVGLKKYLRKQQEKYSFIKTLLRGNTPVYLYDIYYHLKITNGENTIDTKNIKAVFQKSNYITLIGDAGSGKSTLVKHLFLNAISQKQGIPVLVELRYLNDYQNSFEHYIYDKIFENKLSQSSSILDRLLNNGKFVFFLDGFDELNSQTKPTVISNLNSFINRYGNNYFILTTRPYSDVEHLPLFHNYQIKGLDKKAREIEGFIHKQLQGEPELAGKIVQSIKSNKSEYIESFLTNPLLLSLYILTFQSDSSVPSQKYIFYRRVINALFSEHDSKTKLGFPRERLSNLNQEQFESVLKAFCFVSFFESKFSWDSDYIGEKLLRIKLKLNNISFDNNNFIKDLKLSIALWIDDNGLISFAHRSMQEYFAALFIKHLNPTETERIYQKIIDRFSNIQNLNETENFLSLCEEMDEINFKKFYLIPLLHELKSHLDISSDESLGKSFLLFFASAINFSKKANQVIAKPVDINDTLVYKAIYIHLPYTRKLYSILQDLSFNDKLMHCNCIQKTVEMKYRTSEGFETMPESVNQISLSNQIVPDDLWALCKGDVINLTKEYLGFINTSIEENHKFIRNAEGLNKELVDLI